MLNIKNTQVLFERQTFVNDLLNQGIVLIKCLWFTAFTLEATFFLTQAIYMYLRNSQRSTHTSPASITPGIAFSPSGDTNT